MTLQELGASIQAVCPIIGATVNADGSVAIAYDPAATPQQQQAAQTILQTARVNGNPSRLALDPLTIFSAIKPGGTLGLSQAQQLTIVLACAAVVLSQNPALAAKINQALGLNIVFDQANPNG